MKLPKNFLAIYICSDCESELEMFNCYVPHFPTWCDECHQITTFRAEKVIHKSFDWDRIEEIEDGPEVSYD